ncbi:MAG: DUF2812 domain-containing protein [Roseburia sp.]|nr:DUF2812 domain-containing protein [Roseburia sp.]
MTERKTIHRWWWAWNFDREEQWLNEMAMDGWALYDVGFCVYRFEKSKPSEYTIRLEMHRHDSAYLEFMEETGAEYIGRCAQWMFFRKKSSLGQFDIFSDIDSRIRHLNNIINLFRFIAIACIFVGLTNIYIGIVPPSRFNIWGGTSNLLMACLVLYGMGRIHGKKDFLEKERLLHE